MRIVVLLSAVLLTACVRTPSLSDAEVDGVGAVSRQLASLAPGTSVPSSEWPQAIATLKPKSVRVDSEGAYIQTSSFFVEEAGVFVPREPDAFHPIAGSDPEYVRIRGNVFSYRIRG